MNDKTIDLAELLIDPLEPATDASAFANGLPLYAAEIADTDPSTELDRAETSPTPEAPDPTLTDDASQTADKRANAERNLRWLLKCRSTLPLALLVASVVMIRVPFQPASRTAAKNRAASAAAPLTSATADTPSAEALDTASPAKRQDNSAVNSGPTPLQNLSTASDRPKQSDLQTETQVGAELPQEAQTSAASDANSETTADRTTQESTTSEPPRAVSVDSSRLASEITDSAVSTQFIHPQTANTESVQPSEKPETADQRDISATLPSTTGSPELAAEISVAKQTAMPAAGPTAEGNDATTNTSLTETVAPAVKPTVEQAAGPEMTESSDGAASDREAPNRWDLGSSLIGGGFETSHSDPQPSSSELANAESAAQAAFERTTDPQHAAAQNAAELPQVGPDAYPLSDGARRPVAVHIEPTDQPLDNRPRLTLVNPAVTGGPVRCLVGTRVVELHPGDRLTLEGGPTWPIAFHRGGALPEHRAELSAGLYTFEVSREHGWRLTPTADADTAPAETAAPQTSTSDPIQAEVEGDRVTD